MVWPTKLAARVHAWRRSPAPLPDPRGSYEDVHRQLRRHRAKAPPPEVQAAHERYGREKDDGAPLDLGLEAAAAALLAHDPFTTRESVAPILNLWVVREGPAFALRALIAAGELEGRYNLSAFTGPTGSPHFFFTSGYVGAWRRLRELIAQVDDEAYATARKAAVAVRAGASEVVRVAVSYAFPMESAWASEDFASFDASVGHVPAGVEPHHRVALLSSLDDVELMRALVARDPTFVRLAFTHDHVATAFDRRADRASELAILFGRGVGTEPRIHLVELLRAIGSADGAKALVGFIGTDAKLAKAARAALEHDPEHAVGPLAETIAASPRRAKQLLPTLTAIAERHGKVVSAVAPALDPAARVVLGPWLGEQLLLSPALAKAAAASAKKRAPAPAGWLDATTLPSPTAGGGSAMPSAELQALVAALPTARRGAAVNEARQKCEPASLLKLATALVDAWVAARAPASDVWVLDAFAALGGGDAARPLALLARSWSQGGASRAVCCALDVLAEIPTDAALVELEKLTIASGDLASGAEARLGKQLARRGLDREDLADRLVPTCGLGAGPEVVLDFGPRSFNVVFDESLAPRLVDSAGAPLKSLPRPSKADDPHRAEAARERWAEIRETMREVARAESKRLEHAMLHRRRWTLASFREAIVAHPLLGRLARRVVWASYFLEGAVRTFRVAEDGTFADVTDSALAVEGPIGVPHPVDLADADRAAWAGVLHDYGIVQPFAQVGRAIHLLRDEERDARRVHRLDDVKLPKQAPFVLEAKGWERPEEWDSSTLERTLPSSDVVARIDLSPDDPGYRVARVELAEGQLGDLDPIAFSELVADVERAAL